MTTKIEVSVKTLVTILIFGLALWVIFIIKDVLILLFFAFILKSAISPIVERLEKRNVSRVLAIVLIYLLVLATLGFMLAIIVPLFVQQIANLINNFPFYMHQVTELFADTPFASNDLSRSISTEVTSFSSNVFRATLSIFSGIVSFVTVAVVTFYLLLDERNLRERLKESLPKQHRKRILDVLQDIEKRLGYWVRGQLSLSIIIGILYFIGLFLIDTDYPLALALIAGIFEVIPIIGPILAAIPAVLIALTESPIKALLVVLLFFIIQQAEGHFIVPKVMQKATGLSPLLVLISILVGGRLMGIVGVLLAVPVTVVMQVILFDLWGIHPLEEHPTLSGPKAAK